MSISIINIKLLIMINIILLLLFDILCYEYLMLSITYIFNLKRNVTKDSKNIRFKVEMEE